MKTLITTLATAGLLLAGPGPALADSSPAGSAFERAYQKEKRQQREQHRGRGHHKRQDNNHQGNNRQDRHRPKHRPDRDRDWDRDRGGKRWKRDDRRDHPGRGHAWGHGKGKERGHHKGPYYGKPYYAKHGDRRYYKKRKHYRKHRHHWRPSHYHYGYRWRHLPRNFVRISFGGLGLFYSDGIFYRPHQGAYVVARPPIGAIVTSLPGTAVSVVFGGRNYYVAYDTYYLWDDYRRGYRIVDNPGVYY